MSAQTPVVPRVPNHVVTIRITADAPDAQEAIHHVSFDGEITCNVCGRTWKPLAAQDWMEFMHKNVGYCIGLMAQHRQECRE